MSQAGTPEFSKLRTFLWPIHRHELKKLIPMLIIFFLLSFDYNVLRVMKDTLVITAKHSGAEVIPFIKVWVMFPTSLLLTYIFLKLSNRFERETVFYAMLSGFLGYFLLFITLLYPYRDTLHPHQTADFLQEILPAGFKGLIAMYRYWIFTSFYVMSELWGNIVLFLLFWGFANQVTRIHEAKRFYGLFGIGTNFSGIAAGQCSILIGRQSFHPSIPFGNDAWEQSMFALIGLVLLAGIITMVVFRWFNTHVLTDPRFYEPDDLTQGTSAVKPKFSMRENLKFLTTSRYMICLAVIVMAYNLVINLVEVLWKHQVRELYPSPSDYSLYMNQVTTLIGILATITSLIVSGNSIRKFGWTFTALITPMTLLITSIGFFSFFFLKGDSSLFLNGFGFSPLAIVVFFGSAQNCLSRAAKYTVFDATKEIAFVPLPAEAKIKAKAAIDGVCNRLGKSGGSIIYQCLLLIFSTLQASAPYVAGFLFIIITIWISATKSLGKQFSELTTSPDTKALPSLHGENSSLQGSKEAIATG